jgi:hypothetical protein
MSYVKHSKNFSVANFTATLEQYLGGEFDIVVYNSKAPSAKLVERYAREGETLTRLDLPEDRHLIGEDLVATSGLPKRLKHDKIVRSLIRHDPAKIAKVIAKIARI